MARSLTNSFARLLDWFRGRTPPTPSGDLPQEPTVVAAAPLGLEERRAHPRFDLGVPVAVKTPRGGPPLRAFVADISPAGCLISTEQLVPLETEVSLAFRLSPHGLCGASGRVVRVTAQGTQNPGFGVQFTQTNVALEEFLARLRDAPAERRKAVVRDLIAITIEVRTR
jgi:hypothetical protein